MISMPLLKRNLLSSLKIMAILYAVMTMYTIVIIYMFDPALSEMLEGFQNAMPEMMRAFGMSGMASTLLEFIRLYLYGFIMLIFPLVFSIIQIHRLLTHYIDCGSMATLLATPNSRTKVLRTQWVSIVITLAILLTLVTVTGLCSCMIMFPNELDIKRYLLLNLMLFLFHLCLAAMIFLAGCLFNDSKTFYLFGAGLPILFYLFQMLSDMGEKLEWLRNLTLFTLFPSETIVTAEYTSFSEFAGTGILGNSLVLIGLCLIFYAIGYTYFKRKDLPL